ncbi:VOC family protein [Lentzea sp. NPDC004782]|uniref:VOC family protein n=1 Tax=Lentzea sp. NPDC004782 TaxID=3154458 RepID=UPI0033AAF644
MGLGVPDLAQAREFYEKHWQLEVVGTDDDRVYLGAACPESHVLRLRATDESRVDLLSLAAETRADVDAVAARVTRHPEARLISEPGVRQDLGGGYGVRFLDCDGRTVEVAIEVARREFVPIGHEDSRPKAISHVVFNTSDINKTRLFYESVLGFKVSDWVEDFFCFMRTNEVHHLLAFTSSPHHSLNHIAFEVNGLDEFMRATGGMMRRGHQPVWGPGRHGVGNNTFSYFRDPSSGFVMEYTTELELVDESWTPTVHPAGDTDRWGTSNELDDTVRALMRGKPDAGLWTPPPR